MSVAIGAADDIGDFLYELRMAVGMTQGEVAEKVGMTYNALCLIENGHNHPKFKTLLAIAKACDVDLWLVAETPGDEEYTVVVDEEATAIVRDGR